MGDQIDGWVDQPKIYRAGMAIVVQNHHHAYQEPESSLQAAA